MMSFIKKIIYTFCWFILIYTNAASANENKPFKPPGQFIHLGMHVMYIDCVGDKSPTVLIDVGIADSSANWYEIAKTLSKNVRTCVYDRAGYGWSDPGPGKRTTSQIVHELNRLLELAKISGPFVLVGHSFGGFTARYFAATRPDKVVGVVLVDSSHPDQIYRLSELDNVKNRPPLKITRREPAPENMTAFEKRWYSLNSSRKAVYAQMDELKYFKESAYEVKHAGSILDIPLVVLTRGKRQLPDINGISLESEWREMQKDLLNLSTNSSHVVIEGSGHNIYKDAPNEVISHILRVVNLTR